MIQACALADLPPGESIRIVAHVPVAVFNADGELFAIDDTCTHQDASLSEGWLEDCMIECPLHAACFDLRTGKPTGHPAKRSVRRTKSARTVCVSGRSGRGVSHLGPRWHCGCVAVRKRGSPDPAGVA